MHWLKCIPLFVPVVLAACGDATGTVDTGQARVFLSRSTLAANASHGRVTIQRADSGGKRINLLKLPASGRDSIFRREPFTRSAFRADVSRFRQRVSRSLLTLHRR